jgi:hypothetical protein
LLKGNSVNKEKPKFIFYGISRAITPGQKKVVKSNIKLSLFFFVPEIANHLNFIHEVENHKRQAKFDFGLTIFSFWSYAWKDAKK